MGFAVKKNHCSNYYTYTDTYTSQQNFIRNIENYKQTLMQNSLF